ncbi:uncharacterized protein K441DRAFT_270319 [Cenococcum geophilum 1.58]|uniref:uncharacterized protein n=1 Tax=Cenococcum geophilum 1.58 TaxID=794803 RepID=UPI00358DFFF5|nr:hypothetical protein K441DRAFT_270319 [Cenococcum geophilum 1.58]
MVFVFAIENHVRKTSLTSCERNLRRGTTHDNSIHRKTCSASRRHGLRRRTVVKAFVVLEGKDTRQESGLSRESVETQWRISLGLWNSRGLKREFSFWAWVL